MARTPRRKAKEETPDEAPSTPPQKPRGRAASRPYPTASFEEALDLASAIQKNAGSNAIRRLTLFDQLKKSPESSTSRLLIISAGRYGLIKGGVQSEQLQLTPDGDVATNDDLPLREQTRSRIKLAVSSVAVFSGLYEKFSGQKLPSIAMLEDAAGELGVIPEQRKECIELFVVNLRFVGLLRTLSGAERILTTDHALDQLPSSPLVAPASISSNRPAEQSMVLHADAEYDRVCFFIGPIGEAGSEHRKHSDLVLEHLIRPAVEQFGLEVRRADEIQNPGLINKQIFEYLLKSRLAIADMSFHNPNVFYEMAIRHANYLPTVQIIRQSERIPFDVGQSRTIILDMTDIHSFVPKLDTYRLEIANHVRSALDDPTSAENPLSAYFPNGSTKSS